MDNYINAMKIKENTRKARPGDIVIVNGITCTIREILYQEFGPSDRNDGTCDWIMEFIDTEGKYRNWKQYFDGGVIIFC